MIKSLNQEFVRTLQEISAGQESSPRGLRVREKRLQTLEFDPCFSVPEFKARSFNWNYFMGELAWYLQRDTSIGFINNFSNFWKRIATPEGYINSNYGYILFSDQLEWALKSLQKDPYTRQAICFVNSPRYQYEGNQDFVCTMYLNFWIDHSEEEPKLDMKVQMRSNDIFYGLSYDAPFFAFVQQTLWHWLKNTYENLQLGKYYHCADNIHYYEAHFDLASRIEKENPQEPKYFLLKESMFLCKDGQYLLLSPGQNFLKDVNELLEQRNEASAKNEEALALLKKYFWIQ